MRLLIIGDLHGRKPKIHFKDFDAIVFVGDVCDDRELKKYYKQLFRLVKKVQEKEESGTNGKKDENEKIPNIEEFIINKVGKKEFERMEQRSIKKGHEILKYLNSFGKPVFMVAGNWDESYGPSKIQDMDKSAYNYIKSFMDWWLGDKINSELTKGLKNIRNCMYQVQEFNGVNLYGYGLSSAYEAVEKRTKTKRGEAKVSNKEMNKLQEAYERILNKLKENYKKRTHKSRPTIFITHNIPYNTKLDKVKQKGSYAYGMHFGSTVARWFIKKFRPFLCIGGHVHEGTGRDNIGRTKIINPGFGQDAQVLMEIEENEKKGKIRKINFYGKEAK